MATLEKTAYVVLRLRLSFDVLTIDAQSLRTVIAGNWVWWNNWCVLAAVASVSTSKRRLRLAQSIRSARQSLSFDVLTHRRDILKDGHRGKLGLVEQLVRAGCGDVG